MKEAPSLPWWFSDARKWFGLSVLTSFRTLGEVRERKSVTWYSLTACVLRERRQRGREGWVRKDTNRAKWGLTCWKSLIENFKLQPLSELGEMNSCWMSNEKLKKKKQYLLIQKADWGLPEWIISTSLRETCSPWKYFASSRNAEWGNFLCIRKISVCCNANLPLSVSRIGRNKQK